MNANSQPHQTVQKLWNSCNLLLHGPRERSDPGESRKRRPAAGPPPGLNVSRIVRDRHGEEAAAPGRSAEPGAVST